MTAQRTQIGIIGAGPAGLFLAHLLQAQGIESVILEHRSEDYVLSRVRAGVLEQGTVDTLDALGLGERMRRDGIVDDGLSLRYRGGTIRIDLPGLTGGKTVMIYGQQEVVTDLIAARKTSGQPLLFEAEATALERLDTARPLIRYRHGGAEHTLECDFVAACDGYHGIGRASIPPGEIEVHERTYGFAWFGVLARAAPLSDMTYSNSDRGFALCSRRSREVSRLYLQVPADDEAQNWSDDQFWDELHARLFDGDRSEIQEGPIFQRDVAQLRAFVAAPMRYHRLFLAGDAAHIVPPTGAKGLNLAVSDARLLATGLADFYRTGSAARLDRYSDACLSRIWRTVRFSTHLTGLLHRFPEQSAFDRTLQLAELDTISASIAAQTNLAEQYVGLPLPAL